MPALLTVKNLVVLDSTTVPRPQRGRPPSGPDGEKVSEYRRPTLRLPEETLTWLQHWSRETGVPQWRLVDQAIRQKIRRLPASLRKAIQRERNRKD